MAIIAVLAAIAIPMFVSALEEATAAVDIDHYRVMESYTNILNQTGEPPVVQWGGEIKG